MPEETVDIALLVDQTAALIGLPLPPEYRSGVIENMERIAAVAQLVTEFPLPEAVEPSPIFEP